jgi:hypothetical protein
MTKGIRLIFFVLLTALIISAIAHAAEPDHKTRSGKSQSADQQ